MRSLGRRSRPGVEFWPGFVDALSTMLIVIIFLVLVFVLAQFFLGAALSTKDTALDRLKNQIAQLTDMLSLEKSNTAELRLSVSQLSTDLDKAAHERDEAASKLAGTVSERDALAAKLNDLAARTALSTTENERLSKALEDANKTVDADKEKIELQLKQLDQLQADIAALQTVRSDLEHQVSDLANSLKKNDESLTAQRDKANELDTKLSAQSERTALAQKQIAQRDIRLSELLAIGEMGQAELSKEKDLSSSSQRQVELLNIQIAELRKQLTEIQNALGLAQEQNKQQNAQIADLGQKLNVALANKVEELAKYRSEFFGRLRQVLGNRQDVQVVGDRFVFQSEVLFDPGSAELGQRGRAQILALANTLKELGKKIPGDLKWVLRVDGHTDKTPIHNARFASNWELSAARAIAVVKFLAAQGIPPDRLAAAGFGEYQPLGPGDDDAARKRNRRIELKLTER